MTDPGPDDDTADLRSGPPLHDKLLALLPLIGTWHGVGHGVVASRGTEFDYCQSVEFVHDGRPFLAYASRSWLTERVDGETRILRPAWRESGFWRVGPGDDDIEVVLASNTGQTLVLTGTAGDASWELAATSVAPTPTASHVDGERRLYGLLDGDLVYATELASGGSPLAPHLNARLLRR